MKIAIITLIIGIGVALTIVADVLLKKSDWYDWRWIVAGFVVYGLVAIPVAAAFHYVEFGKLFLIWEAATVMLGLLVASWYYKEPFTTARLIAFVLAMAALYFSYQ